MAEPFYEKYSKKPVNKKAEAKALKNEAKKKREELEAKKKNNSHKPDNSKFSSAKNHNSKKLIAIEKTDTLFNFSKIPSDAQKIIDEFDLLLESSHPLNSKQRQLLPKQIRELSHFLTDERGQRHLGYMNQTTALSSYVHYFMWWNLVRLTRLFSNLPDSYFDFADDTICLDIGSGPLTVVTALFLAKPALRQKKLTWYCMDISQQALSFGEDIFLSISARLQCEPWKIIRVKGELGTEIKEKVSFVTSANCFNELNDNPALPPDFVAKKISEKILSYTDFRNAETKILVIEPGVPKSARLVSLIRDAFIRKEFNVISPCPHHKECNMQGKKGEKWCNFCFSAEEAPKSLKKLSESAELPKDRAVLSFVAVEKSVKKDSELTTDSVEDDKFLKFRIASDLIRLPGYRTGYYACSSIGLLLIVTSDELLSGDSFKIKMPSVPLKTDEKSGALIIQL